MTSTGRIDFGTWLAADGLGPSPSGRTQIFMICNRQGNNRLGLVKWYGPWRKYAFFTCRELEVILDPACLHEIADFCKRLTKEHNARLREVPTVRQLKPRT